MSAATAEDVSRELSGLVRRLADPVSAGESVQTLIYRVARRAGLQAGQVKRLWYQEWIIVPAHVADTLRQLDRERECARVRNGVTADEITRLVLASLADQSAGRVGRADVVLEEDDASRDAACHGGPVAAPGLGSAGG